MNKKLAVLGMLLAVIATLICSASVASAAKSKALRYRIIGHGKTYDVVRGHGRTLVVYDHKRYVTEHGDRRYRVVKRSPRFVVLRRVSLSATYEPGNTQISSGTAVAAGLPTSASSTQSGNFPSCGNDGLPSTRWAASSKRYPQWWMVDLGGSTTVTGVRMDWYSGSRRAYRYRIETSLDGVNFTTAADRSGNLTKGVTTDAMSITARYVRVHVLGSSASGAWASTNEVTVFADAATPTPDPTPSAVPTDAPTPIPTVTPSTTPTPTPIPTPSVTPSQTPTYYVKNDGNDSADGRSDATAWRTVSRVVSARPSPGAVIAFRCGDVWRESIYLHNTDFPSGTDGHPITFTSYGSGEKPKFLGGRNLSSTTDWTESGVNIWRSSTTTALETVALHMNGDTLHGRQKADIANLAQQGDFCWANNYTYLYSVANPGSFYSNIESALYQFGMHCGTKSYITVRGLDFRYYGRGGLSSYPSTNHIYEYNDVSWIGPGILSFQAGNGIGGQGTSHDIIRYNRVHECIDAGLSTINYSSDGTLHSNAFYGNVVSNCEYGYEQQSYDAGDYNNIQVYENIFYDMGDTIWHDGRAANDKWGCGLQSWNHASATAGNCGFDDNIVYKASYANVRRPASGWSCQGNRYYGDGAAKFVVYGVASYDFVGWKAAGNDSDGALLSALSGSDAEVLAQLTRLAGIPH